MSGSRLVSVLLLGVGEGVVGDGEQGGGGSLTSSAAVVAHNRDLRTFTLSAMEKSSSSSDDDSEANTDETEPKVSSSPQ